MTSFYGNAKVFHAKFQFPDLHNFSPLKAFHHTVTIVARVKELHKEWSLPDQSRRTTYKFRML